MASAPNWVDAFTLWDPGSPPSRAHPAPTRLAQLCAQGSSNQRPPRRLQYITLNTESWQGEKPLKWKKKTRKESKQWLSTRDKSRTLFTYLSPIIGEQLIFEAGREVRAYLSVEAVSIHLQSSTDLVENLTPQKYSLSPKRQTWSTSRMFL